MKRGLAEVQSDYLHLLTHHWHSHFLSLLFRLQRFIIFCRDLCEPIVTWLSKFKTVPLSLLLSVVIIMQLLKSIRPSSSTPPPIHLQSSSHSVPRGLTRRLAQQYIRPGLTHPSSLLHHHRCLDSISRSFCSTRDITTALKWCHGV